VKVGYAFVWRYSPIVNERKRDWLALDRKLGLGCPFDVAANLSGIPLEEAQEYANSRLKNTDETTYQLRLVGQAALGTAIEQLTKLAKGGERRGQHRRDTDLHAAQALAKLAIDSIKLSGVVVKKEVAVTAAVDLFDNPGNWVLKKPS
jgi:hypothetical protein